MSLEAWGADGSEDHDHLLDAGWWDGSHVELVVAAIKELVAEPLYERGIKCNGISTRFLMRLTALRYYADLLPLSDAAVVEALAVLESDNEDTAHAALGTSPDAR